MEKVLELARRRLHSGEAPRVLDLLASDGCGPRAAPDALAAAGCRAVDGAERPGSAGSGLPEVWNRGIRSFYDLLHGPSARVCSGTACRFADGGSVAAAAAAASAGATRSSGASASGASGGRAAAAAVSTDRDPAAEVHCLGRCYEAPTSTQTEATPIPRVALSAEPVVLRHLLGSGPSEQDRAEAWADYQLPDGPAILGAIAGSGLRGRGGAAYPTAAKWKAARDTPARDRYVVANGDEGDPGAYIDRLLLEEAPHSVLAGMLACARAIGARSGVVYVRAEYPRAAERVRTAVAEAEARGVLGGLQIRVVSGAGSYVAGEETALLRSAEGLRAEPSPKPPYPAQRGLYGFPTIVQNIETLSVVPWIVRNRRGADTKAVCLAGAVARPGVVEVDLGTPLRRVLEEAGGGPRRGCTWKMALVGGPLGRVVGADEFDVALSFEALAGMGHAGVVVLDETVSARSLAEHLFAFARSESCGACAPCRIGSARLASCSTVGELERLMETMEAGSLCGFGQGVARPLRDLLRLYGDEVLSAATKFSGAGR